MYFNQIRFNFLSLLQTKKIPIPLPPIEVQKEIANILDKFDRLTHSITQGLPYEIALRQKQYIYYRDKLLDFAENDKNIKWLPLEEVATLQRRRPITKNYIESNKGSYPVYSSQTTNEGIIGSINSFDFEGEFVSWTTRGAYAGTCFHRKGKFSITSDCGLIKIKEGHKLNYKFLFYWLSITAKKYVNKGMGNPKLMAHQTKKIPIPLPPIEVQKEIVNILDTLTSLTSELTSELSARKKQFNYYRALLLNFVR